MERETLRLIDEVARRRAPNLSLDPYIVDFLNDMITKLEEHKREVTAKTLKDYVCLYGPAEFGGFDAFILDCYQFCGNAVDLEAFLQHSDRELKPVPPKETTPSKSAARKGKKTKAAPAQPMFKTPTIDFKGV